MTEPPALGPAASQNSGLELLRELVRLAGEQDRVHAHGREGRAPLHVAAGGRLLAREDPRGLAACADALDRALDRRLDFGVRDLAEVTQSRGEVRRPDEDAIDAVG